jgi:hypothetical protein
MKAPSTLSLRNSEYLKMSFANNISFMDAAQLLAPLPSLEEAIRFRAYQIYLERSRLDGHAEEDWARAEAEIKGTSSHPRLEAA